GLKSDRVGEGVHAGVPAGEGVIGRQHRLAVAAGEVEGAGVGGGGVVVVVQGGDGDAERAARGAAGRGGGRVVRGRGSADADRGVAADGTGDRIRCGDGLAAGRLEGDGVVKSVHARVAAGERVVAWQHGLAIAAG